MNFYFHLGIILGIIDSVCAIKTFTMLIPVKKKLWKQILFYLVFWMMLNMKIFIGDPVNLPPTMVLFFCSVFLCCEGIPIKKSALGMLYASTAFSVSTLADNFIDYHTFDFLPSLLRLFFYVSFYLWFKHHAPEKDYELSPGLWRLLFALTLPPFGIVVIQVLSKSIDTNYAKLTVSNLGIFSLLTLAATSFIGLLWTVTVLSRQKKMEEQERLYEVNRAYYHNLEAHQFQVRRLRHDMANHLQILLSLPEREKNAYIRELTELPVMQGGIAYCSHSVVNAVLNAKMDWLEQETIELEHHIAIPESDAIGKTDMCAIFADSLDNAIEACQKLPPEKRKISMDAMIDKGLFVYQISNPLPEKKDSSTDECEKRENSQKLHSNSPWLGKGKKASGIKLPQTTKKDAASHGLGLKSIAEIVKRYHGSMEIKQEEGTFSLFLYLPVTGD